VIGIGVMIAIAIVTSAMSIITKENASTDIAEAAFAIESEDWSLTRE